MNNYVDYFNYLNNINQVQNNNNYNTVNSNLGYEGDPYECFMKGNMFKNLYSTYKNYKPYEINPNNEKEYLLLLVQIYGFAAHDLNLYLDVYPNDGKAINLREKYVKLYSQALMDYENKYGALNVDSNSLDANPWPWDSKTWPWEVIR